MKEMIQGGVRDFSTPLIPPRSSPKHLKCFSIMQNEKCPKLSQKTCINTLFRHVSTTTAWRHISIAQRHISTVQHNQIKHRIKTFAKPPPNATYVSLDTANFSCMWRPTPCIHRPTLGFPAITLKWVKTCLKKHGT